MLQRITRSFLEWAYLQEKAPEKILSYICETTDYDFYVKYAIAISHMHVGSEMFTIATLS